jgi:DNA-binding NarL/FixJ family response regulator
MKDLIVQIHSTHPLALRLIKDILGSDPDLRASIKPFSGHCEPVSHGKLQILILDTHSAQDWASCLDGWQSEGGLGIGLVSSEPVSNDLELRLLHLGASGILRFGDNLPNELPKAVHVVARGQLWIRRHVLDLYVKKSRTALHSVSASEQRLTSREKEILRLLQVDLPNRVIAQRLTISERTIKFHVSNILHKLNLTSRKELKSLDRYGNVLLFDTSRPPVGTQLRFSHPAS